VKVCPVKATWREPDGIIYFPRPPGLDGGTLVIPVIDLDAARRYTVRVPLPAR
jgi:hypothetical protein